MSKQNSIRNDFDTLVADKRAQLLSILIGQLKDFELAEDVLQDALIRAWSNWQEFGMPRHPKSWLLKTAYNLAIDKLRRQQNFKRKLPQISHLFDLSNELNNSSNDELITDERLKLIFTCCHPALDQHSQVALTLTTICGFSTEQAAKIFMLKTPTLAQRLVRAKRKIKHTNIPFKKPAQNEFSKRLDSVLAVIYFIYNQGYYATENPSLMNENHTDEAIYLAQTLNQLLPKQAELLGLLALMYFHLARFQARYQNPEKIISLEHQNRKLWDQTLIESANNCFKEAIGLKSMGPYQIQAAISGVHSQAPNFEKTDWNQIILLYEKLYHYLPIATVQINQAVAMVYNHQAHKALSLLKKIKHNKLDDYLPFYLAKAHALKSLNKKSEAINYFSHAMALSKNTHEKTFIKSQLELINH